MNKVSEKTNFKNGVKIEYFDQIMKLIKNGKKS